MIAVMCSFLLFSKAWLMMLSVPLTIASCFGFSGVGFFFGMDSRFFSFDQDRSLLFLLMLSFSFLFFLLFSLSFFLWLLLRLRLLLSLDLLSLLDFFCFLLFASPDRDRDLLLPLVDAI
jgi:hypothetical protein